MTKTHYKFFPQAWIKLGLASLLFLSSNSLEGVLPGPISAKPSTLAFAQDSFAATINPAGEVTVEDRVDLNFRWLQDRGHTKAFGNTLVPTNNGYYDATERSNFYFGDFGINKNFRSKICDQSFNWSFSFVAYTQTFFKTSYDRPFPLLGSTPLGFEYLTETFAPVLAVKLPHGHSLGVSFNFHVNREKINGRQRSDAPGHTVDVGHVTNRGYSYAHGSGVTVGWRWQVNKNLSVGASYRPKVIMSRFKKYEGLNPDHGRSDIPERLAIGLFVILTKKFGMTLEYEWVDFRGVQASYPLLNAQGLINVTGSKHGPSLGYRNQHFYRVGLGYQITDWFRVRASYLHARTPVRRSQTFLNSQTCNCVSDYVTVGATFDYCAFEFSVLYEHGFAASVKGHNSVPSFIGGGEVNLYERINLATATVGYKY